MVLHTSSLIYFPDFCLCLLHLLENFLTTPLCLSLWNVRSILLVSQHPLQTKSLAASVLVMYAVAATEPDTQVLNTIYVHWDSPYQLVSWDVSSGAAACNMTGVHCDAQSRVVSLSLYNIPTGVMDPLIFSLTSLTSMSLVQVNLIGVIPSQISRLTGLQVLQLSNNYLVGNLQLALSLLVRLTSLELSSNRFTGSIPQQLSTLKLLRQLQLGDNRFSGPLPVTLSALTSLVIFYAPFNTLSGQIPAQYSALQQLKLMSLDSNSLKRNIPDQLTSISNLSISVSQNLAMCGSALSFGPQASTTIGTDCPGPPPRKCVKHVVFTTRYFWPQHNCDQEHWENDNSQCDIIERSQSSVQFNCCHLKCNINLKLLEICRAVCLFKQACAVFRPQFKATVFGHTVSVTRPLQSQSSILREGFHGTNNNKSSSNRSQFMLSWACN